MTSPAARVRRSCRVDQPWPPVSLGPNSQRTRLKLKFPKITRMSSSELLYNPPPPRTFLHSRRDIQRQITPDTQSDRYPNSQSTSVRLQLQICFQIELPTTQLVNLRRGQVSSKSISAEVIYRLIWIQYKLRKMVKAHSQRMAGFVAAAMVVLLVFAAHADAARPVPAPFASAPAPVVAGDGPSYAPSYAPAYSPEGSPVGSPAYAPSSGPSSSETPASAPGPVSGATLFD